jgi:hypothetical protein
MRRLFIVGLALCGLLASPGGTIHAQTPPTNPSAFNLTPWYFPHPALVVQSQVETNTQAAADPLILQQGTQSFADLGRTTGYFMQVAQGNLDKSGNSHPVFTYVYVSQFGTPAQATAAFQAEHAAWEAVVTLPTASQNVTVQSLNGQTFGDTSAEGLYVDKITGSTSNGDISMLLFQRGTYVIEVYQSAAEADFQKYGTAAQSYILSIGKALDAIAQGSTPAALPAPTVNFSIYSVRFEANHQTSLKKAPVKQVKVGTTVQIGAYLALTDAPPNAVLRDTYKLTWHGHSVTKKYSNSLGAYPPDYYHDYIPGVTLRNTGTYKVNVTVSINGVAKKGSASIKVIKKAKALTATTRQIALHSMPSLTRAPVRDALVKAARDATQFQVANSQR